MIKATVFYIMHIICLKHVTFEGPGAIAHWAGSRGHRLSTVGLHAGESIPSPEGCDMLVIMGGPMNIYEENKYPWLAQEKAAIRTAIDAGKVVLGICLGAQLIADALGSKVAMGPEIEIGWFPIQRSADCPKILPLPEPLRVFHWHGDNCELPDGAVCIASSEVCPNQAFVYQEHVLGLQCHLETTREGINALIEACHLEICDGAYIQSAETMRAEPDATFDNMHKVLFKLLDHITAHA